jgi:hypothetical protein
MTTKTKNIINQLDSIFKVIMLEQEEDAPPSEDETGGGGEEGMGDEAGGMGDEAGGMGDEAGGMGDEAGGMGGMGYGMGGEEKNDFDITTLGRIYELKKIYSRLVSIESHLADSSNINLLKVRNYTLQAIELFELISSNLDKFKDKLTTIIVLFYKFIDVIYSVVSKYYIDKEKKENK